MPLDRLIDHINSLVEKTVEQENELKYIPFSKISSMFKHAVQNYRSGLTIILGGLNNSLIKKAQIISTLPTTTGKFLSVDQVIYKIYQELISSTYSTAERFNTDVAMLIKSGFSWELYYWLLEIPQNFGVNKIVIFQEGTRFLTQTFSQEIIGPLKTLIELAKNPSVPGSLEQVAPLDLLKYNPIEDGFIVTCIRGEADNPLMWPILCHEMFEMVDMDKGSLNPADSLVNQFESFLKKQEIALPPLDPDHETNAKWILEILMDFLAINSFGPMYAKSLVEFCALSPYYPTPEYPEMCSRIYCVYLYVTTPVNINTDIFSRCQEAVKKVVEDEISKYEEDGDLSKEKEESIRYLYSLMSSFRKTLKIPSFIDRLNEYIAQSQDSTATLKEIMKKALLHVSSDPLFIPFKDPVLSFDNMSKTIMHHHIPLAIDPNILLNVVLANHDVYEKDTHLSIIIDSIKKWKIKKVWNASVRHIQKT